MIALECVKYKCLIRLRNLRIAEPTLVGEVHLSGQGSSNETRRLRVHLEIDSLRRLDADNKFITSDVPEDTGGDVLELYANFNLRFVQGYDGL